MYTYICADISNMYIISMFLHILVRARIVPEIRIVGWDSFANRFHCGSSCRTVDLSNVIEVCVLHWTYHG